ncbi:dienelactone hydrolase family protein [uncultured Rhodospira sp.]|uniref:dienelactone hydrolase family protein n=1 Tax=uncultured Rhodospira sp. TaxID=1936189 RepID=UPI0026088980|nr:dienelactone hydrolase family protein [uncultured Rhodospira sp.]
MTRTMKNGGCGLAVALVALCGAAGAGRAADDSEQARPDAVLAFPTRDVAGVRELYADPKTPDATAWGTLTLPDDLADGETVPAMIILHGSGGEWSGRGARHAAFLARHGIAALVVETFESRGLGRGMAYIERLRHANLPDQVTDAYAALEALAARPAIDAERIGVMGYSMGGMSTFLAAYDEIAREASDTPHRFGLHVAFYAPCAFALNNRRTTGAPIVALWGTEDESTDKAACTGFLRELEAGGSPVTAHWLEGAAHGWNNLSDRRFYASLPTARPCWFRVRGDGTMVEEVTGRAAPTDTAMVDALSVCSDRGYTIGHDAEANETANRLLLEAIGRALGPAD